MSEIREKDSPFLRCSVLHYSVVSAPSASVVSGTELPQMMNRGACTASYPTGHQTGVRRTCERCRHNHFLPLNAARA
jgi:hypothetical protein